MSAAAVLEIRRGNEARRYPLADANIVVGRGPDNDVVLDDDLVSRRHGELLASDLGSGNGTRLNGAELEPKAPRPLREGDRLEIGHHTLLVHLSPAGMAAEVRRGDCDAASLENCLLPGIQQYSSDAERRVLLNGIDERFGDVFGVAVSDAWLAIAAIMLALFLLLFWLQKRKDVI